MIGKGYETGGRGGLILRLLRRQGGGDAGARPRGRGARTVNTSKLLTTENMSGTV